MISNELTQYIYNFEELFQLVQEKNNLLGSKSNKALNKNSIKFSRNLRAVYPNLKYILMS